MASGCHAFEAPDHPVKFKKRSITRGESYQVKSKEDFSELAKEYMKVNAFEECFPPKHLLQNESVKVVINLLFPPDSMKTTESSQKALVGYNFINSLKIYGYTDKDLEPFSSSGDHSNVILFFDDKRNLLVYIRVCEKNPSTGKIEEEIKMCDEFIQAFLLLNEKAVKDDGVLSICSFVALLDTSSEDLKNKTFINNHDLMFFLTKENFEDGKKFNKMIDNCYYLARNLQKNMKKTAKGNSAINNICLLYTSPSPRDRG